jgi:hypothetical protein
MVENTLESSKITSYPNIRKIDELEKWFRFEYPSRLNTINRYTYLGLKPSETRYALELEAFNKENELRKLKGLEPLPELKLKKIL